MTVGYTEVCLVYLLIAELPNADMTAGLRLMTGLRNKNHGAQLQSTVTGRIYVRYHELRSEYIHIMLS